MGLDELENNQKSTVYIFCLSIQTIIPDHTTAVVVVVLLFYIHGKWLWSCLDSQLT